MDTCGPRDLRELVLHAFINFTNRGGNIMNVLRRKIKGRKNKSQPTVIYDELFQGDCQQSTKILTFRGIAS